MAEYEDTRTEQERFADWEESQDPFFDQEEYEFAKAEEALSSTRTEMTVLNTAFLRNIKMKRPPFICGEWLPEGGMCLIYGEDGVGKSFFATTLAAHLAAGEDFLGAKVRKSKVVYLQMDMSAPVQHERILKQTFVPNEVIWGLGDIGTTIEQIKGEPNWVMKVNEENPDVIFFDTLRRMHKLDENSSDTPRLVYGACRRLFGPRPTFIFIHHTRKDQANGIGFAGQSYRGSGAWRADVDAAIRLRKSKGQVKVVWEKARTCESVPNAAMVIDPYTLKMVEEDLKDPETYGRKLLASDPEISPNEFVKAVVEAGQLKKTAAYELYKKIVK